MNPIPTWQSRVEPGWPEERPLLMQQEIDALRERNAELESDLEKHRELLLHHLSVIDPLRDKNKRLCGLLREALSFMYPEIALHTVIEQEIAP